MANEKWSAFSDVGAPVSGDKIVGLHAGANVQFDSDSVVGATPTQVQQSAFNVGVDTGMADAYVVDLSPAVTSLTNGLIVIFEATNSNATTAPTLDLNSLGPTAIQYLDSQLGQNILSPNDILAFNLVMVQYNADDGFWVMLNPAFSAPYSPYLQGNYYNTGTDTGVADAYVVNNSLINGGNVNYNPLIGTVCAFQPVNANTTTTPSLNFNGSGVNQIIRSDNTPIQAGDLSVSVPAYCVLGTSSWILLNPQIVAFATSSAVQSSQFNIGSDSGVANAYVVDLAPAVAAYTDGMLVAFRPSNDNLSGACTLALNGLSAKSVYLPDGAFSNNYNPLPDDFRSDNIAFLIYSAGRDCFWFMNPSKSWIGRADVQQSSNNTGTDTGAADAYVVNLSPSIDSYTNGLQIAFTPTNANITTTPTLNVNGVGAKTIVKSTGSVVPNSLTTSMIAFCMYSAAIDSFVLITPAL